MLRKNTAGQVLCFGLVNASTGAALTGATVSVRRCIDGTFAAATGTVTEDSGGLYKFAASQADTNGNDLAFYFTATGAIPVCLNAITTACDPTVATNFGITALPATAVTTNASLLTSGTGTDQLSVTSGRVDLGKALGTAVTLDANNVLNVSAKYLAGTALTARDIGASVLLSSGTGTGQISLSSGAVLLQATQTGVTIPTVTTLTNAPSDSSGTTTLLSRLSAARAAMLDALSLRTGTAQAGAAGTITLDSGASATDDLYKGQWVVVTGGTGAGQSRLITGYVGSTKVATVHRNWATNPDNTSVFYLLSAADIYGVVLADTATTLTNAPSDTSGTTTLLARLTSTRAGYLDNLSAGAVALASGVTVTTNNDKTGYSLTVTPPTAAQVATALLTDLTSSSDFNTAGSFGKLIKDNLDAAVSTRMATFTLPTNFSALGIGGTGHILNVDTLTTYTGDTPQTGDAYARLGAPAGASVSADIAAVQADLPQRVTKNTALSGFTFPMVLASDHVTGATGKTVTATRSIDGAAFAACTNAVSEVSNGFYKIDFSAADLNGNVISFLFTATACDPTRVTIVTEPT